MQDQPNAEPDSATSLRPEKKEEAGSIPELIAWDMTHVSETLGKPAVPFRDVAFGDGHRFTFGEHALELYPGTGVVRLTGSGYRLELFRQVPPDVDPATEQVSFIHEGKTTHTVVSLTRQGLVRLVVLPALENAPTEAASSVSRTNTHIDDKTPVLEAPGGAETPLTVLSQPASGNIEMQEPANATRLTLSGRLGRNPTFRTTHQGMLIASFPLAVHHDDGSTTWHTILAFQERAEQLRDQLAKGEVVEVVGYRHTRERRLKNGTRRQVEEIYATVIKPR